VSFSDAEIDAAVAALSEPGRLADAQSVVARSAPALQKILGSALKDGGWFDTAHEAAVQEAISAENPQERAVAVRTLFAEETRLTMLVGVAVGFELARELGQVPNGTEPDQATDQET
jgi:hypothetical protein